MNLNVEKFGRVFISKELGNNGERVYEQLKYANFSNLDLKWYDMTGDVHQKFQVLKGKKFWMGVKIENTNKDGNREQYCGKFLVPLALGELEGGPDLEYLNEVNRIEMEIAEKLNFVDVDDEDEVKAFTKVQGIFSFFTGNKKLIQQSPLLAYLAMVVMIDDLLDCGEDSGANSMSEYLRQTRYSQMIKYLSSNLQALRGESTGGMWKNVDTSSIFRAPGMGLHAMLQFQRYYSASVEVAKCLREEALKLTTSEEEARPFFSALEELYESGAFEPCREWGQKKNPQTFEKARSELAIIVSGIPVTVEAIALQMGIRLKEDIRRSFLFKWFRREAATHSRKVNDLLSYNNEVMIGKAASNQVFMLHHLGGLSLGDALKQVNEEANLSALLITECGKVLIEMFEEDEQLIKYIEIMKGVLCGYMQSCSCLSRYHDNLVWDCYVDVDDD